ncbi:DMT family transporter [Elstera cyanobacteriorum]|uniref:DMT family transporter n=1 Tax=Elstera cyanobacteriorum TaxID=2022747 RepID=UPI00235322D4|nr:DMT family transporter [Elstera cyanobacteriorum]MCK6443824.1 DMT family transporter [Elstera cyanobacteriorum]
MTSPSSRPMSAHDWLILGILSLLWGGSFLFGRVAVAELPPFTIVLCRVGGGALILAVAVRAMGLSLPRDAGLWGSFFVIALLSNVIPFSLIVYGQKQVGAGLASILNATTPLFALIVTHFMTEDEKLTRLRLAGVVGGFLGVTIMLGPSAVDGLSGPLLAQAAILGAAFAYGWAVWYGRRLRKLNPILAALGQLTAATLVMLPLAAVADQPWTLALPSLPTLGSLAGLAALSTALAYVLYFRLLARVGAGNSSLVTFLIPPSALLMGILFLGERLTLWQVAGMLGIGFGLALVDGRLFARR